MVSREARISALTIPRPREWPCHILIARKTTAFIAVLYGFDRTGVFTSVQ